MKVKGTNRKFIKSGNIYRYCGVLAVSLGIMTATTGVQAATDSLLSVTDEAQIRPVEDGSGKYLMKSDGFYCLKEDGARDAAPAVHYFDHMEIDGTVLDGFYYHDETGKFKAGASKIVRIKNLTCAKTTEENGTATDTEVTFDGCYMVNNLGKLTAAPQVRYIADLTIEGTTYNGYYYFDENGKMVTENGSHELEMTSNGQHFSGMYYFGGPNGVLEQTPGTTPEGFPVDETGKVQGLDDLGTDTLKPQLESMLSGYEGQWSVYVKNLDTEEEILLNNTPLYSASLIKVFVMADTYANMDQVLTNEATYMKTDVSNAAVKEKVDNLLWNMITVSDNESCNELGRLQSEKHDFLDGAEKVNEYIQKEGYTDTTYQSTLHPSASQKLSLGGHNTTTVKDCGLLLERIYKGECVSKEASESMLNLLKNQQNTVKIPAGISDDVSIANKTGETDEDQHDIAIVYGPKTTYILCIMSQDWKSEAEAITSIQNISRTVYSYLNL